MRAAAGRGGARMPEWVGLLGTCCKALRAEWPARLRPPAGPTHACSLIPLKQAAPPRPRHARYYKALYGKQIGALLGGGAGKNLPGMRNLAMELRKLCCHPVRRRGGGGGRQTPAAAARWGWDCAPEAPRRWLGAADDRTPVNPSRNHPLTPTMTPSPHLPTAQPPPPPHQFLCDGLEDDMRLKFALDASKDAAAAGGGWAPVSDSPEADALVRASGKMLLLHKLLPKLRAEGRQCLIFSQFKVGEGQGEGVA